MRLEILHGSACPGAEVLRGRLALFLERHPGVKLIWQVVTTEDQARAAYDRITQPADRRRRPIRANGPGRVLSYRLYPGDDGRPAPAPSQHQLVAVLARVRVAGVQAKQADRSELVGPGIGCPG